MTKYCETFAHTADIGLQARADTFGELLEALGETMADMIFRRELVQPIRSRQIELEAEDVEGLTIDFLNRLLLEIETQRLAVAEIKVIHADEHRLEAELVGENYDPQRHEFGQEVKAATYHQLHVGMENGEWVARVIIDL